MFLFDKPPTPSCHASTVVEVTPGKLLAAWFGGKAEGAKDVQIWLSRFDGAAWSVPEVVGSEPGEPCWNPVLFRTAKGALRLWYKAGPSPERWTGFTRTSADGGVTWSKAEMMPAGFVGPVRAKPIQLADGTLLAPTSVESYRCWTPYVDRSADGGATWLRSNPFPVAGRHGQIQPTLFTAAGGKVVALMRSKDPLLVCRSESADGGKTFAPAVATEVFNPNSGIDAVRTAAGGLFLIYNPLPVARTPLSVARSNDDGKTWAKVLDLESEVGEFSYPALVAAADGMLHAVYTWKRKHIKHVPIDPAKLRG